MAVPLSHMGSVEAKKHPLQLEYALFILPPSLWHFYIFPTKINKWEFCGRLWKTGGWQVRGVVQRERALLRGVRGESGTGFPGSGSDSASHQVCAQWCLLKVSQLALQRKASPNLSVDCFLPHKPSRCEQMCAEDSLMSSGDGTSCFCTLVCRPVTSSLQPLGEDRHFPLRRLEGFRTECGLALSTVSSSAVGFPWMSLFLAGILVGGTLMLCASTSLS